MPLQIEVNPFQFNSTVLGLSSAVFNSVSATALSGVHYGDGSNLTGISTYNGSDVKALTGNWQSTYSTVSSLSANWNNAYTWVNSNSATATFTTSVSSPSISATYFYGDGSKLLNLPNTGGGSTAGALLSTLNGNFNALSANVAFNSLTSLSLSSNYLFGTGSETVLSDGIGNNDLGNGANTLSFNFSGGVFVGGNGTLNTPSIITNTINTTPINNSFISVPSVVYLTANLANVGSTIASFGLSTYTLQPNGIYELLYNIYYIKNTANTVTYTLSGNNNFSLVSGEVVQTINTGSTVFSAPTKSYINNTGGTNIAAFPVTASLTTGATHTATIRFFIINSININTIQLAITNTSGTVTPLAGSYAKLTRIG